MFFLLKLLILRALLEAVRLTDSKLVCELELLLLLLLLSNVNVFWTAASPTAAIASCVVISISLFIKVSSKLSEIYF